MLNCHCALLTLASSCSQPDIEKVPKGIVESQSEPSVANQGGTFTWGGFS